MGGRSGRFCTGSGAANGLSGEEPGLYHDESDNGRGEFAFVGRVPVDLPEHRNASGNLPDCLFHDRGECLDHENLLVLSGKPPQPFLVNRVRPDLHERDAGRQEFLNIGCADSACNDSRRSPDGEVVEPPIHQSFFKGRLLLVEFFVQDPGMGRDHHVLPGSL